MTDSFADISWLAVALSFVAAAVLGGVYFGALVPKAYLAVLGRSEAPAPTPLAMAGPLVCNLVVVLTSAVLVAALGLTTTGDAVVFGLLTGVGYLVAMTLQIAINPNFPHPVRYTLLNAPYFLVVALASSLLLVLV